MSRAVLVLASVVAFASASRHAALRPPPAPFSLPEASSGAALASGEPEMRTVSGGVVPSVHSATAVETADGKVLAAWYGGSREGAKDVALYSAVFDPETGSWSRETVLTTREETARDLGRYVKKLGNPVLASDASGRILLYYVSVSFGGWSGSAVNVRWSEDDGRTWSRASRLVTSPFLNVSTLVRGPAVLFEDGTLGLPVYHELLGKFGELVRLSRDGRVLSKHRLSRGYSSLQPVVVAFDSREAIAFLRRSGSSPPRVLVTETSDSGQHWSELAPATLPNPDSAVAALKLQNGKILIAFNDSETDRSRLVLAESDDRGQSFRRIRELEPPEPLGERDPRDFAYPWLLESSNGDVHLLYTWNRRRIIHLRFRPERAS